MKNDIRILRYVGVIIFCVVSDVLYAQSVPPAQMTYEGLRIQTRPWTPSDLNARFYIFTFRSFFDANDKQALESYCRDGSSHLIRRPVTLPFPNQLFPLSMPLDEELFIVARRRDNLLSFPFDIEQPCPEEIYTEEPGTLSMPVSTEYIPRGVTTFIGIEWRNTGPGDYTGGYELTLNPFYSPNGLDVIGTVELDISLPTIGAIVSRSNGGPEEVSVCREDIVYLRSPQMEQVIEDVAIAKFRYRLPGENEWTTIGGNSIVVPDVDSIFFQARIEHDDFKDENGFPLTSGWGPVNKIFIFKTPPALNLPSKAVSPGFIRQATDSVFETNDIAIKNITIKGNETGQVMIKNVQVEGIDNYAFTFTRLNESGNIVEPTFNFTSGVINSGNPIILPGDTSDLEGFNPGRYLLQINNVEGNGDLRCFANYYFYIKEPEFTLSDNIVMSDYNGFNISCIEASDGQITVQATGGIAPYTFKLVGKIQTVIVRDFPTVDENTTGYDNARHEYTFTDLDGLHNGDTINYELTITDAVGMSQTKETEFDGDRLRLIVPEDLRFEGEVQRTLNEDGFDVDCTNDPVTVRFLAVGGVNGHLLQIFNAQNEEVDNQSISGTGLREFQVAGLVAGEYRALLSDANRSETSCIEELTFTVTAPEALALILTSQKLCSGDNSGSLLARANGGIPEGGAYTYALRNIDTNEEATLTGPQVTFTGLARGTYEVTVTDKYLCTFSDQVTIVDPEAIEAFFTLTDIVCYGDSTGVINASLSGGALPLQVTWYNNENAELSRGTVNANGVSAIADVPAGAYRLRIEDANGCSTETFAELTQPDPVSVELGGGTIICPGMTHPIDAGTGGVKYSWTLNDEVIATEQIIEVGDAGLYTVTVTDADGCEGVDAFELTVLEDPLNTDFGMPSEAYEGDTVAVIDITWPLPDSVSWNWDENVQYYLSEENCEKFIFPEAGSYNLTLRTFLGECQDELVKTITIVEGEDNVDIGGRLGYEALIKEFMVYPNPNEGDFNVKIDLSTVKDIRLTMIRQGAATQVFSEQWSGQSTYVLPFQLMSLTPGVYILMLETVGEKETIRVMIN
ncbi:hypothetical protein FNH22_03845 [Fulvivirga sp. M361]|uniref:hypothetical protein n=1 Tax=Fulvivirga sp. M361 TaxID=2594266 RepID=UPI00117A7C6F|nr:hypothetical protein [Fulvivirga sp. M361]TRX61198.1 hypothetical protein FNH22_03845 [Fulvivirga sp. M361]